MVRFAQKEYFFLHVYSAGERWLKLKDIVCDEIQQEDQFKINNYCKQHEPFDYIHFMA